jgi:hypothetical protein
MQIPAQQRRIPPEVSNIIKVLRVPAGRSIPNPADAHSNWKGSPSLAINGGMVSKGKNNPHRLIPQGEGVTP